VTFVFRTSSFFVVFVITLKTATFVVGNTANSNNAADRLAAGRLNDHVERLVDEAVRFRSEAREAAEKSVDMVLALHTLGDRVIECAARIVGAVFADRNPRAVAGRVSSAMAYFAGTNIGGTKPVWHNLIKALTKPAIHYTVVCAF
jgi:hypothetical protein